MIFIVSSERLIKVVMLPNTYLLISTLALMHNMCCTFPSLCLRRRTVFYIGTLLVNVCVCMCVCVCVCVVCVC